ncbi:MAG: hypothetical protein PQJ46_14725, partial [Spirochaetales bacterium]|nr:hypothetical protein [Spirochaetales bacterium]
ESMNNSNFEETEDIRYSGREYISGQTVFSFFPYKKETFFIWVRKPNFEDGTQVRQLIELYVDLEESAETSEIENKIIAEDVAMLQSENKVIITNSEELQNKEAEYDLDSLENITFKDVLKKSAQLENAGQDEEAVKVLEKYIDSDRIKNKDELIYYLANLYEKSENCRDERKAAELYNLIVKKYPLSLHWEDSRTRFKFIERNYIYIR